MTVTTPEIVRILMHSTSTAGQSHAAKFRESMEAVGDYQELCDEGDEALLERGWLREDDEKESGYAATEAGEGLVAFLGSSAYVVQMTDQNRGTDTRYHATRDGKWYMEEIDRNLCHRFYWLEYEEIMPVFLERMPDVFQNEPAYFVACRTNRANRLQIPYAREMMYKWYMGRPENKKAFRRFLDEIEEYDDGFTYDGITLWKIMNDGWSWRPRMYEPFLLTRGSLWFMEEERREKNGRRAFICFRRCLEDDWMGIRRSVEAFVRLQMRSVNTMEEYKETTDGEPFLTLSTPEYAAALEGGFRELSEEVIEHSRIFKGDNTTDQEERLKRAKKGLMQLGLSDVFIDDDPDYTPTVEFTDLMLLLHQPLLIIRGSDQLEDRAFSFRFVKGNRWVMERMEKGVHEFSWIEPEEIIPHLREYLPFSFEAPHRPDFTVKKDHLYELEDEKNQKRILKRFKGSDEQVDSFERLVDSISRSKFILSSIQVLRNPDGEFTRKRYSKMNKLVNQSFARTNREVWFIDEKDQKGRAKVPVRSLRQEEWDDLVTRISNRIMEIEK